LLRSPNPYLYEKNGGLGADADQNFGWLLKFSCVALAFRFRLDVVRNKEPSAGLKRSGPKVMSK
jgi:hypothetical protein